MAQGKIKKQLHPTNGNGTNEQVLRTNGNGAVYWDDNASSSEIGDAVSAWLDENVPAGQTLVADKTLSIEGAAAEAQTTGEIISNMQIETKLSAEDIPNTVQSFAYGLDGNVSTITHTSTESGVGVVRTDTFTYGTNSITEVRTLSSGESLTIVTNTETLQVTVTYSAT